MNNSEQPSKTLWDFSTRKTMEKGNLTFAKSREVEVQTLSDVELHNLDRDRMGCAGGRLSE